MNVSATFALEAQQCLERGDAAAAIALCRTGLAKYPHYVTAYLVLARAHMATGDYDSADKAIQHGIQTTPRTRSFSTLRRQFSPAISSASMYVVPDVLREVVEREVATPFVDTLSDGTLATGLASAGLVAAAALKSLETEPEEVDVPPAAEKIVAEQKQPAIVSVPEEQSFSKRTIGGYLQIIEPLGKAAPKSSLRSNNIRLIPGLEFTSLRMESGSLGRHPSYRRTYSLPELPTTRGFEIPFDDQQSVFAVSRYSVNDIADEHPPHSGADTTTQELDDLAERLSTVQMPSVNELLERESDTEPPAAVVAALDETPRIAKALVSETMANIYVMQGAYSQALEAYQALMDVTDDAVKNASLRKKIEQVQSKLIEEANAKRTS